MGKIKPIAHEDELSLVEHLDELRTRLIVTLGVFVAVLAVCFWQNAKVLEFVNKPLPNDIVPSTFAVSEAFMSTLTVTGYAALIIISPLVVYQLYAFVVPAFSEDEQRVARPLVLLTPLLFIAGCAFGYYFVLPTAVTFLLNFNDDQFNVLLRASDYYSFFGLTVLAMGALFELPLAILIAARMGIVTSEQLRSNRRYAVLAIAVLAMLLPGVDPISMLIEMVPLLLLFELSIWLTVWFAKPASDEDAVTPPKSHEPDAAMRLLPHREMLFDLQGPRKTAVKVIYLGLAILMAGGLVLFGIGSNVNGGLADVFGGGSSSTSAAKDNIEKYSDQLATNAKNKKALEGLIAARYSLAGDPENFNQETGEFSKEGKDQLNLLKDNWDDYLKVTDDKPNLATANYAVSGFLGLQDAKGATQAQQIITQKQPNAANYLALMLYASYAGDTLVASGAEVKAKELATKDEKKEVATQIKGIKDQVGKRNQELQKQIQEQFAQQAQGAQGGGAPANPFGGAGGVGGVATSAGGSQ